MIPLIDLAAQYSAIKKEINEAVSDVLESSHYIMGQKVREFEEKIASYTGTTYAISCANGTDALILSLHACGIGAGDEVVTSPFTFFATAEAISRVGATPVFADVEIGAFNINADLIEEKITNKTKAIIPVHIFGQPAAMDTICKLADKYGIYVIEDACQAIGAAYKGRKVGSLGDIACFSFFPSKNLGAYGDGGMITTNNKKLASIIRALRVHGSGTAGRQAYNILHENNETKHDSNESSHCSDETKHDSNKTSHSGDRAKHDSNESSYGGDETKHDSNESSHGGDEAKHDSNESSHCSDETKHDSNKTSHSGDRAKHDNNENSHCGDETKHDSNENSNGGDETKHDSDETRYGGDETKHGENYNETRSNSPVDSIYDMTKYYNYLTGYNSRLDELQAAILLVKLKYLDEWNKKRRETADYYSARLQNSGLVVQKVIEDAESVYHMFVLQSDHRDSMIKHLSQKGISTGIYYPVPLHLQKVYEDLGYSQGSLPVSEYLAERTFAIPIFPELTRSQKEYISDSLLEVII